MQRTPFLVTALLVAVTMAGCLGDEPADTEPVDDGMFHRPAFDASVLSPKQYDILPVEEVWVSTTEDGKRMHNAVYRPDTEEKTPVWINFSPYWGDTAESMGDAYSRYMIEEYVPRGYTVVLSAVRGTGHSEGCFQIGGDVELQDSHAVIGYFASQEWSNGNIGAGGKSYDSTTQNGVIAKYPHPALKTIFHVSGITDMYRYNYREGVAYTQGPIFNTYYYLQGTDEYGASFLSSPTPEGLLSEDPESLARVIDDAACTELPLIQAHGVGSGATGLKTDYWIERDWSRYIADSAWEGSIFFVHGLQDWNVKPDHILPFMQNLPNDNDVLGWLHQSGHVYPERGDWNETMLRWMDHYLKGIDTQIEDLLGYEILGDDGVWRKESEYPPVRADVTEFRPADAVDLDWELIYAADGPVRYSGAPQLTIDATVTNPDPVLTAVLSKVGTDGSITWVNEGVLRGYLDKSLESPDPLTPGETRTFVLDFYPQDDVLQQGESWLLTVGNANPRQVLVLPTQTQGIVYDMSSAVLTLPLVATDNVVAPQPEEIPCFAC